MGTVSHPVDTLYTFFLGGSLFLHFVVAHKVYTITTVFCADPVSGPNMASLLGRVSPKLFLWLFLFFSFFCGGEKERSAPLQKMGMSPIQEQLFSADPVLGRLSPIRLGALSSPAKNEDGVNQDCRSSSPVI